MHQLVNKKNFDNIKMHGMYVNITYVMFVCMYVCMCVYVCVCVCMYVCMCMYVCVCICKYVRTYVCNVCM